MKISVAIVLALAAFRTALAEDIVVIGKLLENKPMEYVPDECPENYICLRSWWKSVVNVQKTVHGSVLSGHVAAAVMQHTSLNPGLDVNATYVSGIDDEKTYCFELQVG